MDEEKHEERINPSGEVQLKVVAHVNFHTCS